MDEPKCSSEVPMVSASAALVDHDYLAMSPKENMAVASDSPALQLPDDASSTSGYASDSSSVSPNTAASSAPQNLKCKQEQDLVGSTCNTTSSPQKIERKLTMLERKFNSVSKGLWWQRKTPCQQFATSSKVLPKYIPLQYKENIKKDVPPLAQKQSTEKPQNVVKLEPIDPPSVDKIEETINSVIAKVGASDFDASTFFPVTKSRQQSGSLTILDNLLAQNGQFAVNLANSLQMQQIGTIPLPPNCNLSNFLGMQVVSLNIPMSSSTSAFNVSITAAETDIPCSSDSVSKRTVAVQTENFFPPLRKSQAQTGAEAEAESDSEDEGTCCHRLALYPKRRKMNEEIESQSEFYFDSHTPATSNVFATRCRPFDWIDTQTCARVHPFIGRRVYLRPEDSCARTRPVDRKFLKEFNWFYSLGHPARDLPHIPRLNSRCFKRLMKNDAKANGLRSNYDAFATANRENLTGLAKEITESRLIYASEFNPSDQYASYKEEKIWPYAVRCGLSKIHGVGCFATCDIPAKAVFLEYYGEIIRNTLCDLREAKYGKQNGLARMYINMFTVDSDFTIDATMKGCVARFINHSCAPNSVAKVITYEERKRLLLIAKRPILAGEEICYDYKLPSEPENRIPCCCKASKCRGYMN